MATAQASADWRGETEVWLDHASLSVGDAGWLAPVRTLTLWAVKVSDGLLASLPCLTRLDLRGGSAASLPSLEGCTSLTYLQLNQVRGLSDLSVLPALASLRMLSLYGLPKVQAIPSLAPLKHLARVDLGSMKGLRGLTGLHDAPSLRELLLIRAVSVSDDDAARLAGHKTLERFDWFGEDVPVKQWQPFEATVGKPPAKPVFAKDWLDQHGVG